MSDQCDHQDGLGGAMPQDALAAILAASDGLLMPSESDYPFELFRWPGPGPITPEALLAYLGLPPDTPVETRDALDLLDRLAAAQGWHGEEERATTARFAQLRDTLTAHLGDLVAYRVGRIQITLIIAGRDASGAIVGLRTTLIET